MCQDHAGPSHPKKEGRKAVDEAMVRNPQEWPGDWQNISLPPAHVLSHLTDAHCHPTDLQHDSSVYDAVRLGGLASMGTIVGDQDKVRALGMDRPWKTGEPRREVGAVGPRVVSCFGVTAPPSVDHLGYTKKLTTGYHPWFAHRYTLATEPITKEAHYTSVFFPPSSGPTSARKEREKEILIALLPFFPEPIPFSGLVDGVRENLQRARTEGRLCMLGEVGLDGAARVLWPKEGRHLYDESIKSLKPGQCGDGNGQITEQEEDWKRLTPFKISLTHQRAILEAQMEIAVELGVPVSLHCVAAPGPTIDVLKSFRDKYGTRFTNRVNVDLHSGGGWSPEFYLSSVAQLSNLFISPSIFITARHISAPDLLRVIKTDRILVESDSRDVRLSDRLVWGAVEWIARVRGWKLEDGSVEWEFGQGEMTDEEWVRRNERKGKGERSGLGVKKRGDIGGHEEEEGDVWAVKTIERNWARFMGLIEPYE